MKDVLQILAEYNSKVNHKMFSILSGMEKELLDRETGVYFKNIYGILNHLALSDTWWLQRIRKNMTEYQSLNNSLLDTEITSLHQHIAEDVYGLIEKIKVLDGIYENMITNDVKEADISADIKYVNYRKENKTKKFNILLLHIFNHHTHHRGEISACLDILKVENNFSNLIELF